MQQFFAHPVAQVVILLTATLIVIATGVYLVGRFRGRGDQDQEGASDHLTKFREMHERGVLSDEEFREIKTQLASHLQAEISDSEETG